MHNRKHKAYMVLLMLVIYYSDKMIQHLLKNMNE